MDPTKDMDLESLYDEYVYECAYCWLTRDKHPDREYASYSRDRDIVSAAAREHRRKTGHPVHVYLKKWLYEESGRSDAREERGCR